MSYDYYDLVIISGFWVFRWRLGEENRVRDGRRKGKIEKSKIEKERDMS